jgi:hypothetical protein
MSLKQRAQNHPWLVTDYNDPDPRKFRDLAWSIATPESEEAERIATARYRHPLRHLPRINEWDNYAVPILTPAKAQTVRLDALCEQAIETADAYRLEGIQ